MRGRCTGTLADVLTDLICKAVLLTLADSSTAYVHEGMAVAAEAIAEQTVDTLAQLFFAARLQADKVPKAKNSAQPISTAILSTRAVHIEHTMHGCGGWAVERPLDMWLIMTGMPGTAGDRDGAQPWRWHCRITWP